ncbi:MAG: tetratricopeptide repeat protein [Candidatus Sericytochromatia bacterium]
MSPTEFSLIQARQALQSQDWQAADVAFTAVLALEPRHLEALTGLATVALAVQDFDRAVAFAQQAVAAFPESASAHYALGLACYSAHRPEAALTHLRQATALDPDNALAWVRLGQIYTRHGLPFYGFSCLERAQQIWTEQGVDPLCLSQAAWRAGLWGPFQRWTESFYLQIPDLAIRLWVYSRWLDLFGYQGQCSDADWETLLSQWERQLPSRLSVLPVQKQRLTSASSVLRVACLCDSASRSSSLLDSLVAANAEPESPFQSTEIQFFTPVSVADNALWQSALSPSPQALLPALQAWQPDLIVDQVGFSRPEVLMLPRQLPQSLWLSGTDPDFPSPSLSGVESGEWPWFFSVENTAEPLAYPEGAPVVGYMGPVRALSPETLQLWGDLLLANAQLRLCLFSAEIDDPLLKQYLEQIFQSRGISAYRLRLLGNCASQAALPFFFGQVHLVLAPHPRSSWFEACQALWHGRPVLSLADPRWQRRNGVARVLSSVGWEPGLAENPQTWLQKAQDLLTQRPQPADLRALLVSAEAKQAALLRQTWVEWLKAVGPHDVA